MTLITQSTQKPFYPVYVEPPKKKPKNCYEIDDHKNRRHIMDAFTQAFSYNCYDLKGLTLKIKQLIDLQSSVNWCEKSCFHYSELGEYVTPLHVALEFAEFLEDDLIKLLLSHGAIMHKHPSEEAQAIIDKAARELFAEQHKLAIEQSTLTFMARKDPNSSFNVLPIEIQDHILQARVEAGPATKKEIPCLYASEDHRLAMCDEILNSIVNPTLKPSLPNY